jgi:hypothetical protein
MEGVVTPACGSWLWISTVWLFPLFSRKHLKKTLMQYRTFGFYDAMQAIFNYNAFSMLQYHSKIMKGPFHVFGFIIFFENIYFFTKFN